MNADLLAMLGGGVPGSTSSSRRDEGKTILSFKAGKMTPTLQPNGKYLVTADPRRGEINIIYHTSPRPSLSPSLKFEWRDRRTRTVGDELTIFAEDNITFGKVDTGRDDDRVYLLQYADSDRRYFYWMQDKLPQPEGDDPVVRDANLYLKDLSAAARAAGDESAATTTTTTTAAASTTAPERNAETTTTPPPPSSTASSSQQVDALSNILQNLGMPPQNEGSTSSSSSSLPAGAGTLTLADLQGAMAGLATSSPAPPPLNQILSPSIVDESGILNDKDTVSKLVELLPDGQRTEEFLRENLHSPQVKESLKSLMAVIGSGDEGLNSVIANFGLERVDGDLGENPLKVFLDSVVRSVEKEKDGDEKMEESKEEEENKDDKMEEEKET